MFRTNGFWRILQLLMTCLLTYIVCLEAAHTLLSSGFNLGCSMKRTTLSSDASSSGKTLDIVLVSVFLSLGFIIWHFHSVRWMHTSLHTLVCENMLLYMCYSKYALSSITEPKGLIELCLFGTSLVLCGDWFKQCVYHSLRTSNTVTVCFSLEVLLENYF